MVLVLLTSLNCCMSTLRLIHYTLLPTPTCWKSNNTNARLMAFTPSLALDPTFGIHSHKTLDTAQPCHLLKPNWNPCSSHSISILTNISTQFLLQSMCVCVCVCVCVCACSAWFCLVLTSSVLLNLSCDWISLTVLGTGAHSLCPVHYASLQYHS